MEYRTIKKILIACLAFKLIGCISMNMKDETDQTDIEIYSSSDLTYKGINEYFGYKDQNNYYINLNSEDLNENKNDKFIKIGKFISSDATDKIKIRLVEREIKINHKGKYPPNMGVELYLNKSNKNYSFPFTTESDDSINVQMKIMVNIHEFKSNIYKFHTSCESCFEPSVVLSKNGQDYVLNLILKNIGTNDFDLEGFSTLLEKGDFIHTDSSLFLIFNNNRLIQLDKKNLLDSKYLNKIMLLKKQTVMIPFIIHYNEIPLDIKNNDLTKEKFVISMLSKYKSGELDNKYFKFSVGNK